VNSVNICITGPESSGKTTLAEQLALHYKTFWVEEAAREYLQNLDRKHELKDLKKIAKQQLELNLNAKKNGLIFTDTDLLTIKIWAEDKYGSTINFVEENYIRHQADLYLLCFPDLEWQPDELREDQFRRNEIFNKYEYVLSQNNFNFSVIKAQGNQRLRNAIHAVDSFLLQ
jgi:nicotinamide riboside kinase